MKGAGGPAGAGGTVLTKSRRRRASARESPVGAEPKASEVALREEVAGLRGDLDRLSGLYRDLLGRLQGFASMQESYLRLVALYARYGTISPELLVPSARDPISKEVIRVLAQTSEGSIQEITEKVRASRGSASRRIVKARLAELSRRGVVQERVSPGGRGRWCLSDEVVRKWAEVLGLVK